MKPASYAQARSLARARLPRFLFDYIDGGSFDAATLRANAMDLDSLKLRQRVLRDVSHVDTTAALFGEALAMPLALAPIGMAGMVARRGEVQAARAARSAGVPFCLSTMAVCAVEEVAAGAGIAPWFQLYMIRDRGYMRDLLGRAEAVGCRVLVFTVDLAVPGVRRGFNLAAKPTAAHRLRLFADLVRRPGWIHDVGLRGRPHLFGNIAAAVKEARSPRDFFAWVGANTDAAVRWEDLAWLRQHWHGPILLKGILDPEDARLAVESGMDGIIVSNHGGRQLDGANSTIAALPGVVEAAGGTIPVLVDGGIRSGLDMLKALALGASGCLAGRAWVWALAAGGEAGVGHMLGLLRHELATAMALCGVTRIADIDRRILAVSA